MSEVSSTSQDGGVFSLTQIRHLMRVEFGRAQRYAYPVTFLMVEVDRLGYLRDLYGYDLKEAVLDDVVAVLVQETRSCDYLGRQVDDRLMAVMPHTDVEGGVSCGHRLLERVRALQFEVDGRSLQISISIGHACYVDGNALFFDQLVDAAESALEAASSAGGNRMASRTPGQVER